MTLKQLLQTQCKFDFYRDGKLYYVTDSKFRFMVPINEVGTGTCGANERTVTFMKWVKPQFLALK